ncbi:MAG: SDR family NAD(P)-dependent oxidoreductase [Chloroflexota bacterium]
MYDFSGKVAVITGAGRKRGFGRATALRLAGHGADIVISDVCRSLEAARELPVAGWEELKAVAAEIEALGRNVLPVKCDVTRADEVQAMVSQAMERFGRIDILINNAGVGLPMKPVVDITEAEWNLAFDVMCKGTFLCSKYVVPHMIQRGGGGKIVNLSSQAGKKGQAYQAPYAAAKAAIISFTQSLALELAYYKINVNAVCPGIVETDMGGRSFEEYARVSHKLKTAEEARKAVLSLIPLRRLATVDEVVNVIVFLASDQADYMTGQAINLTGGQTMH